MLLQSPPISVCAFWLAKVSICLHLQKLIACFRIILLSGYLTLFGFFMGLVTFCFRFNKLKPVAIHVSEFSAGQAK